MIFSLKNLIFYWYFVLKFYFTDILSTHLWEKGRIRIQKAQKHSISADLDPVPDPDPQHWHEVKKDLQNKWEI